MGAGDDMIGMVPSRCTCWKLRNPRCPIHGTAVTAAMLKLIQPHGRVWRWWHGFPMWRLRRAPTFWLGIGCMVAAGVLVVQLGGLMGITLRGLRAAEALMEFALRAVL